jgi:hypothetical protein
MQSQRLDMGDFEIIVTTMTDEEWEQALQDESEASSDLTV